MLLVSGLSQHRHKVNIVLVLGLFSGVHRGLLLSSMDNGRLMSRIIFLLAKNTFFGFVTLVCPNIFFKNSNVIKLTTSHQV